MWPLKRTHGKKLMTEDGHSSITSCSGELTRGPRWPLIAQWIFQRTIVIFFFLFWVLGMCRMCNEPLKQEFLRISSYAYSASSPHSPNLCFLQIAISRTIFEKGHQRHIFVKLLKNMISRGQDFSRISSCSCSASSPVPPISEPHFTTDQNS